MGASLFPLPATGIKSVQRGQTTSATNGQQTENVTITAVNMSKAFVIGTYVPHAASMPSNLDTPAFKLRLTSTTNLEIVLHVYNSSTATVAWEVIEFN